MLTVVSIAVLGVNVCVTVPNVVAIDQTLAEIWRIFDFSKIAAVRHLGLVVSIICKL